MTTVLIFIAPGIWKEAEQLELFEEEPGQAEENYTVSP